jgi:hypothetical protein
MPIEQIPKDDLLRQLTSERPSDIEGLNNASYMYYIHWMIRKIFGVYDIQGIPETWDRSYLYERIFLDGYVCITDTALGVLPLRCGISGINVFDHPTNCIIANPVLGNLERTIGEDCALVHLQYNYAPVWDILRRYGYMLASCDASIAVNLLNTRVASVFGARNKAEAETYKKAFDQVTAGKPLVVTSEEIARKIGESVVFNRVKESYIAQDVEDLKQNIINDFLSDIGVNNANTEKRERLNSSEVSSNKQEVSAGAQCWLDTLNEGFNQANKLFSLNLSVKRRVWNELSESDRFSAGNV